MHVVYRNNILVLYAYTYMYKHTYSSEVSEANSNIDTIDTVITA